jgi:hypothetical protein
MLVLGWSSVCLSVTYDYPFVNAYEATVLGTPSFYAAPLPKEIPAKDYTLTVFEDRQIPDVFWWDRGFRFSMVRQKEKAPLIFVVAGTGASYRSGKVVMLQKAFYQAGFHVLTLSSPTHSNFIINASTTAVPGHLVEDSRDLYHVMKLAYGMVKDDIEVSGFHITGYSLGAAHSAFIAKIDAEEQAFGIEKVLLINPPVSLYNSVSILDRLLSDNADTRDARAANAYVNRTLAVFAREYKRSERLDFGGDFLYDVYKNNPPKEENLEILIGVSFRFSSRDLIFVADVMNKAGYVVPANRELSSTDSLTTYFKVLAQTGFTDYYEEFFLPFFQTRYPGITDPELKAQMSLKSIDGFLRENRNIGLLGNEDDIILAPGEIDYLKSLFGDRAEIYPTGGHCGNMAHRQVLNAIVDYFAK